MDGAEDNGGAVICRGPLGFPGSNPANPLAWESRPSSHAWFSDYTDELGML